MLLKEEEWENQKVGKLGLITRRRWNEKIVNTENIDKLEDRECKKMYINLQRGHSLCVGTGLCHSSSNYLKCKDFYFYLWIISESKYAL